MILVVNTATKCGLAPQFDGLEKLWKEYGPDNFVILGFPCNQFLNQEPETNESVEQACKLNFWVTFPLFAKIDVNGENESPLYTFLKIQKPEQDSKHFFKDLFLKLFSIGKSKAGSDILWNFEKFLINKNGEVVARYSPATKPEELEENIKRLIK